jgi:menaquinone-dependent protoporphyrinogen oxidase
MTVNYLVTYATRQGSTTEIARAIANTLRECGQSVDVLPVSEVRNLKSYDAVFIGSAVRYGTVLPEVIEFVKRHRFILSAMPVAGFISCQTISHHTYDSAQSVAEYLKPVRQMIRIRSEGYFGGFLDYSRLPTLTQRYLSEHSVPEGDFRNWIMIYRWTMKTMALMTGAPTPAGV